MKKDYTEAEKAELAFIYVLARKLKNTPDRRLQEVALDEMDREQPAMQNFGRFIYLNGKYTQQQLVEIMRLLILIWWYYKDRLKVPHEKIADPLFLKMKAAYESLLAQINERSPDQGKQLLHDYMRTYPGRLLYGYMQGTMYDDRSSKLFSLPRDVKRLLLSNIKIMMDCFESLVDRSVTTSNLN